MKSLLIAAALLGQCPPGTYCPVPSQAAATADPAPGWSVRISVAVPGSVGWGSGTIVSADGDEVLVLTCRHLFADGAGRITVHQAGSRFDGRLIATDRSADLAAVAIRARLKATPPELAEDQPETAIMVGYSSGRAVPRRGVARQRFASGDLVYSFAAREGDSGGGVFTPDGRLAGVLWGRSPRDGVIVPVAQVRRFCLAPALARWFGPKTKIKAKHGSTITINEPSGDGDSSSASSSSSVAVSSPPTVPATVPTPGPPGPQGPAGPPGPQGPPGAAPDVAALLARIAALEAQVAKPITFTVTNPDGSVSSAQKRLGDTVTLRPFSR